MKQSAYVISPVMSVCLAVTLLGGVAVLAYRAGQGSAVIATATPVALVAPAPSASPSMVPDPTASWKTYVDTAVGVSFKYPTTWSTDKTSAYIQFLSPESVAAKKSNTQNFQADNMIVHAGSTVGDLPNEQGKPNGSATLEGWLMSQKGNSAVQSYSILKMPLVNYGSYTLYSVINSYPSTSYYVDITNKVFTFTTESNLTDTDKAILQSIKVTQ